MRKIILLYILLLPIIVVAQKVPPELEQRLQGKTKLNDIMDVVNNYYTVINPEKKQDNEATNEFESSAYIKWLRWEWYMRPRLDRNGDFFDYRKLKQQESDKLSSNITGRPEATNSLWAFAGPHAMTYTSGTFRGLGRVDCIAFHPTNPSVIFVGAPGGGVWKTTNDGATWENISFNLPNTAVSSIAVCQQNPDIIYIATGDFRGGSFTARYNRSSIGIYKTTDGGIHWNPTADDSTVTGNASKIIIHPTNADILMVATSTGVFKTTSGGNVWTRRQSGSFQDICYKPGDPNTVYAAGSFVSGILYSTNGGTTFLGSSFNIVPNPNRIKLAVSPAFPSAVFALMGPFRQSGAPAMSNIYEGLYFSNNSGVTFTRRNNSPNILSDAVDGIGAATEQDQSFYDLALAVKSADFSRVAAAGKCVWRSTDSGYNFISATDYSEVSGQMSRYIHPDIQDMAYNPLTNILYAATDGGVYRSADDGVNWTDISAGIHTTMFYKLAGTEQNGNMFLGGTQDNGVKYRNTATPAFNHIIGGDGFDVAIDPTNQLRSFASGNANVYLLSNGVLLGTINPPDARGAFPKLAHHQSITGSVYAAYQNGIWRRDVTPAPTWVLCDSTTQRNAVAIITCPSNLSRIYFINNSNLYRSDNNGTTWTANLATSGAGFSSFPVLTDIYVNPGDANILFAVNSNGTAGEKVYYSTNAGASWINISGTLPNVAVNCIAVDNSNNAYLGTDVGVFYQAAAESEWQPFYNGLPKVIISDIVVNNVNNIVTAATYGHGVWQTDRFTNCSVDYNVTGSLTGEWFFSVSNQLISNAEVYGGIGTKIHFRAGNEVILNPGFTVYETSNFNAILAACGAGPVPQRIYNAKTPLAGKDQRSENANLVIDTMKVKIKNH